MSTETRHDLTWKLGPAPSDYDLANVRAVMPDRVLDGACVIVRDGVIRDITDSPRYDATAVDGNGMLLIPGIVDTHSDALEKERAPRPNAELPWEFAMDSLEGRLVGAGVTTIFHGAAFQHQTFRGVARSVHRAREVCALIEAYDSYRVDHRILHRLDVFSAEGAEVLSEQLASATPARPALVSHEDHTPGQGQYVEPKYMVNYTMHVDGRTEQEAWENIDRLQREAEEKAHIREANLAWLGGLAHEGRIVLLGHDSDSVQAIDELHERGGHVAEFPTTIEAARRAKELGLPIVAGAPNLLRGRSHNGNVSAQELLELGLLDGLASDYLPSALLGSAWRVYKDGVVDLPTAIGLITSGPARAAGLDDRGALVPGLRADFAVVDDRQGEWPDVMATFCARLDA